MPAAAQRAARRLSRAREVLHPSPNGRPDPRVLDRGGHRAVRQVARRARVFCPHFLAARPLADAIRGVCEGARSPFAGRAPAPRRAVRCGLGSATRPSPLTTTKRGPGGPRSSGADAEHRACDYTGSGRPRRTSPPFAAAVPGFFTYLVEERGLRPASILHYRHHLIGFEAYLASGSRSSRISRPRS